jgi:hypothetical protein
MERKQNPKKYNTKEFCFQYHLFSISFIFNYFTVLLMERLQSVVINHSQKICKMKLELLRCALLNANWH